MKRTILLFFLLLMLGKTFAASRLDLFGDEAFYFMCSGRMDVAFADHPFMTALLVKIGTSLLGPVELGCRLVFLLLGALFPLLIFRLARPLVGSRDAWLAAGLSLVMPATAHLGLLALPDVPHLFLAALALLLFLRAVERPATWLFVAAGVVTALGLSTHYRFVLVPFSFGLCLILTRSGRALLRTRGPWLALLTMLPGLLPALLYNVRLDFAPFRYQAMDRHGSGFDLKALAEHIPAQMVATTPLMYVVLVATLVVMLRRMRQGDARMAPLALFSLSHLGLYLLASPITDASHASIHWPAPGYLPLLVFAPGILREFLQRKPTRLRRALVVATPGLGVLVLSLAFLELNTHLFRIQSLARPFAGWTEVAREAGRQLADHPELARAGSLPLLVADNYMLAGNLELKLAGRAELFVLDHQKGYEHGRAAQFAQWGNGEEGLRGRTGEDALVVVERTRTSSRGWEAWRAHVAAFFQKLEPLAEIETPGGKSGKPKRFEFYVGRGIR
ncbi:MAG: glycosyltransferase family 39 protein [Planctomycetota bacterium]